MSKPPPRDPHEAARAEVDAVLNSLGTGASKGQELEELEPTAALHHQDLQQDISLKRMYANRLLWLLMAQLVVADAVFITYAWAGVQWKLSAAVIDVWLGATLVEVVGIVLVVTRYLFPRRDTGPH